MRHITIRTIFDAPTQEESIDAAITRGLQELSEQQPMELVGVSSLHMPHNGAIFVTVIARETGQVRVAKSTKETKK
jgi:hypothetical protein